MNRSFLRAVASVSRIAGRFPEPRSGSTAITHHCIRATQPWSSIRNISSGSSAAANEPPAPVNTQDSPISQNSTSGNNLPLPDQVRLLMRRVPYPVAIITATDPHDSTDKAFRGMTVSSFNTVTLSPEPVISFNVRRPSETLSALQASTRFLVHLLAPGPVTAALARDFSKGNHNLKILSGEGDYEFAAHASDPASKPLPLLRRKTPLATDGEVNQTDDFPFVLECQLHPKSVDVYDHTIVVGTVVRALSSHLAHPDPHAGTTSAEELCLTYANTRFWEMGHEI